MSRSKLEGKLLKAGVNFFRKSREFGERIERENMLQNSRRARQALRFQEKLVKQAFSAAGIDYKTIERRQSQDFEGIRKFSIKQKQSIVNNSKVVAQRHATMIKQLGLDRLQLDPTRVTLNSAAQIVPKGYFVSDSPPPKLPTGQIGTPGQNIIKPYLRAKADHGFRSAVMFIDFHFIWNSIRDGLLNALAFIYPNGSYSLLLQPACTGNPRSSVTIDAYIAVSQLDPNGQVVSDYGSSDQALYKSSQAAASLGSFEGGPYNDITSLFYNNLLPIAAGAPVLTTVTMALRVEVQNGAEAELDFQSGSFQLNVPAVHLIVS